MALKLLSSSYRSNYQDWLRHYGLRLNNYRPRTAPTDAAIGTILDPKGKAIAVIAKGESYFGEADILGKPYVTGYEPIRDASGNVIGIYYVGYLKN